MQCEFHPYQNNHTTANCHTKKPKFPCHYCKSSRHHFLLCDSHKARGFFTRLQTFTVRDPVEHAARSSVLLPFLWVYAGNQNFQSVRCGTLLDNCSTDDFLTHTAARRMGITGRPINLITEGFGGKKSRVPDAKMYDVIVKKFNGDLEAISFYGVNKIGNKEAPIDSDQFSQLCQEFGIESCDVSRPDSIDMLIGQRNNHLFPRPVKRIGGMQLLEGPLGKCLAGETKLLGSEDNKVLKADSVDVLTNIEGQEGSYLAGCLFTTADSDVLNYFKEENIGIDCVARCGNCSCGQCAYGNSRMSIKNEKEYQKFKNNLSYDPVGSQDDPGPYFRSKLPWKVDKDMLGDNKRVVLGTMNATARRLSKNSSWRATYDEQLRVLVENGFARKITKQELDSWTEAGNSIFYIAHQMVEVPENKSTPVRVVFNSSQRFEGRSLNGCLSLGPDTMNNLQGILLRFRENYVAAAGDIRKMFYCVRVSEEDQFMQLWVWRFADSEEVETFAMTRLVMGNRPSTNISNVALKETTLLNGYDSLYPSARQALDKDAYVDNIMATAQDHEAMLAKITEIEFVAARGGFKFKPWVISGSNSPDLTFGPATEDSESGDLIEKALGVQWIVSKDLLRIKPAVSFGGNKRRGKAISLVPYLGDIGKLIPLKLCLKDCLSAHAKCYDPLGHVLPVKMVGNLLFRTTLQDMKLKSDKKSIPWDDVVPTNLLEQWLKYFGMLDSLKEVTFRRSLKPENVDENILPDLVTFCDGNEACYGANAYALWTLSDSTRKATLIMSKPRLGPLIHNCGVVKH